MWYCNEMPVEKWTTRHLTAVDSFLSPPSVFVCVEDFVHVLLAENCPYWMACCLVLSTCTLRLGPHVVFLHPVLCKLFSLYLCILQMMWRWECCNSSLMLVIRIRKKSCSRTEPWGTTLITGFFLNGAPSTFTCVFQVVPCRFLVKDRILVSKKFGGARSTFAKPVFTGLH